VSLLEGWVRIISLKADRGCNNFKAENCNIGSTYDSVACMLIH